MWKLYTTISNKRGIDMNIVERIKDNFSKGYFGKAMDIPELPKEYPAWTLKENGWVGVAVPVDTYIPFSEQFSQVKICTETNVQIGAMTYNLLLLQCFTMQSRNEFALMCAQFVEPGKDGNFRQELTISPEAWWKRWKEMLGNISSDRSSHDILGELLVLERLMQSGEHPKWSGAERATHDIELDTYSIEVKSTVARYGYEVTVSSIYQMRPSMDRPLNLDFIRFERSVQGRSLDDVARSLKQLGYDEDSLEAALSKAGLESGCVARNVRYKVIEWKSYLVNDGFPCITEASFKDDRLPPHILKITYTLDLAGINGSNQLQP